MKRYTGDDPEILFKNYEAGYRVFGAGIIAGKFFEIILISRSLLIDHMKSNCS